jgi:hypothetical protein
MLQGRHVKEFLLIGISIILFLAFFFASVCVRVCFKMKIERERGLERLSSSESFVMLQVVGF